MNFFENEADKLPVEQKNISRRSILKATSLLAGGTALTGLTSAVQAKPADGSECSPWRRPTNADFMAIVNRDKAEFLNRVLDVFEEHIIPKTMKGVREGNKLFGSATLRKSDLSVVVASTNTETGNPLMHGEVTGIFDFYNVPGDKRPAAKDCIFISTHEPCPLCLSSITWAGFDNFFYLFTYEDSRDEYGIPHDITMLDEIFRCPNGTYNETNKYWSSWSLRNLARDTTAEQQAKLSSRIDKLKDTYAKMSEVYQKAKAEGIGADVPLK